jgi:hypothetical protein
LAGAAACLALVLVVLGLPGGGEQGTFGPFAQAAAKLEQAQSARFRLTGSVESPATGARVTMTGHGASALDSGNGWAEFRYSGTGSPGVVGAQAGRMTEVYDYPSVYLTGSLFAGQLPNGATWVKVDLQRAGEANGIDLQAEQQAQQGNAANILQYLRAASDTVQRLGTERIGGVATTHYRAQLDPQRYADALRAEGKADAADSIERTLELGAGSGPMDVWLDRRHLVRRAAVTFSMASTSGQTIQTSMVMELTDFGVRVAAQPPPASQVFDATDLAAQGLQAAGH